MSEELTEEEKQKEEELKARMWLQGQGMPITSPTSHVEEDFEEAGQSDVHDILSTELIEAARSLRSRIEAGDPTATDELIQRAILYITKSDAAFKLWLADIGKKSFKSLNKSHEELISFMEKAVRVIMKGEKEYQALVKKQKRQQVEIDKLIAEMRQTNKEAREYNKMVMEDYKRDKEQRPRF